MTLRRVPGRSRILVPVRCAVLAAPLLLVGCGAFSDPEPPVWLDAPPREPGYIHATGSYVGALYPEDNLRYALDKARGALSKNLRSRVVADTTVRETESHSRITSDVKVSADDMLENAEHVDTWVDEQGLRGQRGTVWVLMRVPRR